MGGSTFSNFNVDAVQEIQSQSGWMPAEIGRGAAASPISSPDRGAAAFTARSSNSCATRPSTPETISITPRSLIRAGFRLSAATNLDSPTAGPSSFRGAYSGRKTFYFTQYQGFRQVLGTTQVIPVPTAPERTGIDTTAFPGDVLTVPVDPWHRARTRAIPLAQQSYSARMECNVL